MPLDTDVVPIRVPALLDLDLMDGRGLQFLNVLIELERVIRLGCSAQAGTCQLMLAKPSVSSSYAVKSATIVPAFSSSFRRSVVEISAACIS